MRSRPTRPLVLLSTVLSAVLASGSSQAATLTGRIHADDAIQRPAPLTVSIDAWVCGKDGKVADPSLVIGPDRGLANVVVTVRDVQNPPPYPGEGNVSMDQNHCVFEPHVVVVAPDQELDVANSDSVFHNFRTLAKANSVINRGQPEGVVVKTRFPAPEIVRAECDVHYWMSAVVVVAPHAFVAVTGEDGGFTIDGLPPGRHALELWHERLGSKTAAVDVSAAGGRLDFLWK